MSPAMATRMKPHSVELHLVRRRATKAPQPVRSLRFRVRQVPVESLVPAALHGRVASVGREGEAIARRRITRIIDTELRHEVAERLHLPTRINVRNAVWRIVQSGKGAERVSVADAGVWWRRNIPCRRRPLDLAGQHW